MQKQSIDNGAALPSEDRGTKKQQVTPIAAMETLQRRMADEPQRTLLTEDDVAALVQELRKN